MQVLHNEIVGKSSTKLRQDWYEILVAIFWPGPSACTLTNFNNAPIAYEDLSEFHKIRVVAAMG